jgi:hypothetical protein
MKSTKTKKNVILLLSFCLMASNFQSVYAQSNRDKHQQHTGFYLSMGLGPAFGTITSDMGHELIDMSGTGVKFDFKIGGAVKENLILHGTMISTMLSGPSVKSSYGGTGKAGDNISITENMLIGGGLTYYIMPSNLFLSGSLGLGNYSITDTDNSSVNGTTNSGFSMQLKVGKEWWVSRRWGLGIALTYGKTFVDNTAGNEKLNSNRFGILFNATLN